MRCARIKKMEIIGEASNHVTEMLKLQFFKIERA